MIVRPPQYTWKIPQLEERMVNKGAPEWLMLWGVYVAPRRKRLQPCAFSPTRNILLVIVSANNAAHNNCGIANGVLYLIELTWSVAQYKILEYLLQRQDSDCLFPMSTCRTHIYLNSHKIMPCTVSAQYFGAVMIDFLLNPSSSGGFTGSHGLFGHASSP